MDHVHVAFSQNKSVIDLSSSYQDSPDNSSDCETLFWYNVLYAIGSYIIEHYNQDKTQFNPTTQYEHYNNTLDTNLTQTTSTNPDSSINSSKNTFRGSQIKSNEHHEESNLSVSNSKRKSKNKKVIHVKERAINYDTMTRLFCGYWVLYTIATCVDTKQKTS